MSARKFPQSRLAHCPVRAGLLATPTDPSRYGEIASSEVRCRHSLPAMSDRRRLQGAGGPRSRSDVYVTRSPPFTSRTNRFFDTQSVVSAISLAGQSRGVSCTHAPYAVVAVRETPLPAYSTGRKLLIDTSTNISGTINYGANVHTTAMLNVPGMNPSSRRVSFSLCSDGLQMRNQASYHGSIVNALAPDQFRHVWPTRLFFAPIW